MGYDMERFPTEPPSQFICSICHEVFENPLEIDNCQHIYCRSCIEDWMKNSSTCPQDRGKIQKKSLHQPARFFKQLYLDLEIRCIEEGCNTTFRIEELEGHQSKDCIGHWKKTVLKQKNRLSRKDEEIDSLQKQLKATKLQLAAVKEEAKKQRSLTRDRLLAQLKKAKQQMDIQMAEVEKAARNSASDSSQSESEADLEISTSSESE